MVVSSETGEARLDDVGKHSITRRTGLPARDLRVLDPMLSHPSSILGRQRPIVVNLEHVKGIITATEVLMINSSNPFFLRFLQDLHTRLIHQTPSPTSTLEEEAYPALDALASQLSTLNLERVIHIKSRLVAFSGRVQKVYII
ncbi:Magnesium transporter MRS2-B [Glycine soja]